MYLHTSMFNVLRLLRNVAVVQVCCIFSVLLHFENEDRSLNKTPAFYKGKSRKS